MKRHRRHQEAPLSGYGKFAECLKLAKARDEETITTLTSIIFESGIQMSKLIDTLLDFTRARLGRSLLIKPEPVPLRPILEQTVASFSPAYPDRTIQLHCNEDPHCAVDAVRIRQMLSNLVANAIQHGAETSPITVTAYIACDEIVIEVHNNGTLIPASSISTIFDFAPTKSSQEPAVTSQSNHLGIGLYITRKIAEAHGGGISVTSTLEDGTTFEVRVPCLASEHQAA